MRKEDGGAWLEPRDLIVAVDGKEVTNPEEFFGMTDSKMPGEIVLLTVSRLAKIGSLKRWTEVIPVRLTTYDDLLEKSDEFREFVSRRENAE